ncbi:MAG: glycosyltransferase family 1 protein [Clostridiales bacterium]|nr:glycosyltransferase family 1 protein [Clostridiales bacterium]MCF8022762.1 glycosyltransferase family 1 protein [Clostridiales bacterium]
MRIAIFTETFLPMTDGIVTRLTASINQLLELGEEVMILAPGKEEGEYKGAPVIRVPGIPLIVYPEKQFTFPHPVISKALKEFQPDIIHSVNPVNLGAYGVYYAKKHNLPLIGSYHTNTIDYLNYYKLSFLKPMGWKYIRWLHNQSLFNLCTSKKTQQELKKQGINRVYYWEKGVDTEKFSPRYASHEMRYKLSGGQPEKTLFISVGRLGYEKELEKLRPALDYIPNSCLALVGDGPARKYLEEVFQGTNTVFTGFLYGEELAAAYASSDVFVLPSTTETLGLVLLEAMACGIPAIAVNNGPPAEIVKDEVSGSVFSETGEPGIVQVMSHLAEDKDLRQNLGENALKICKKEFGWRKPTLQLLDYYYQAKREWQGQC